MFLTGIAKVKETEKTDAGNAMWVNLPTACSLPTSGADALLFALHALLIHGTRPIDDLNKLLPHRAPNGLWAELDRTGFVEIHDDTVRCTIRNYPDARSELGAAGFNLDEL